MIMTVKKFFDEVKLETKRVSWITTSEMFGYFRMILILMIVCSLILYGIDFALNTLFKIVVSFIKNMVF